MLQRRRSAPTSARSVVEVVAEHVGAEHLALLRTGAGVVIGDSSKATLAGAITSLLEDQTGRRQMGERGREIAARFSIVEHARFMHRIYAGVIEERARGRNS